jgi:hypothetical protein
MGGTRGVEETGARRQERKGKERGKLPTFRGP